MKLGLITVFFALIIGSTANARDDVPSCYQLIQEKPEINDNRELFVIVDQTLMFDVESKKNVHKKVQAFLTPGDRVTLVTFSSYSQDRYSQMTFTGKLDPLLSDQKRRHISIKDLKKFDSCLAKQNTFMRKAIDAKLKMAFDEASEELPNTELTGSLSNFGETLIARSEANKKILLLVSDMLENSDVASFYSKGSVTEIDVDEAMEKLDSIGRFTDWAQVDIYVAGAAYLSKGEYRSQKFLSNLKDFWQRFFEASNANLIAWGQPELMADIK